MSKELVLGHINAALTDGRVTLEEIRRITSMEDGWFSDPVSIGDNIDFEEHNLLVDLLGDLMQGRMNSLTRYKEIEYGGGTIRVDGGVKEHLAGFVRDSYEKTLFGIVLDSLFILPPVISGGAGGFAGKVVGTKLGVREIQRSGAYRVTAETFIRHLLKKEAAGASAGVCLGAVTGAAVGGSLLWGGD